MKPFGICQDLCGVLVVDKPAGLTSFDVIRRLRRAAGIRKIGHTGTLDPMATGVLPLCLGSATRLVPFLQCGPKEYLGHILLGLTTETDDLTGRVTSKKTTHKLKIEEVLVAVQEFRGPIEQVAPAYSAVKFNGQPAYRLARHGEKVPPRGRSVVVHQLEVIQVDLPQVTIKAVVSPGTYLRSLAADIGRRLGTGACLAGLRRLATGPFNLSQAWSLNEVLETAMAGQLAERLLSLDQAVSYLPGVRVGASVMAMVLKGQTLPVDSLEGQLGQSGLVRIESDDGRLLAVYEFQSNSQTARGCLKPVRVLGVN